MTTAYFEDIKPRIIEQLLKAKRSVRVISAYFSDENLFDILCKLASNGLEIELIIADEPMNTYNSKIVYSKFIDSNGKLYLASRNPVQTLVHHKFCLIDEEIIITGSFNWTTKASVNRENVIILFDKKIAQQYKKEFAFVREEFSKEFLDWKEVSVPSGFAGIDKITNFFKPSELICLVGKSGMGKTNFLFNILLRVTGELKIPIGYLGYDLSPDVFFKKLNFLASEINFQKFRSAKLEDYELHQISKSIKKLEELEIHFKEGGASMNELEKRCKFLWLKGAKMIIVDNIDYLLFKKGDEFDNETNRDILGRMKNLSRLLRIPIIFPTAININDERSNLSKSRRPNLNDIGIISHYSDSVISIYREEYFGIYEDELGNSLKGKTEISILKNISGATGRTILNYNATNGKFDDFIESQEIEIDQDIIKNSGINEDDIPF